MKENVAPAPPTHMPGPQPAPIGPPPFENKMYTSYQPQAGVMKTFHPTRADSAASNHVPSNYHGGSVTGAHKASPGMYCDKYNIGPQCTFIKKLVLFDVPASLPEEDMKQLFSAWAPIKEVNRSFTQPNRPSKYSEREPLVWVHFETHHDARQFLARKPERWLGERRLLVEVPREFWDETHDRYQPYSREASFRRGGGVPGLSGPLQGPARNLESSQVPTVLRRAERDHATSANVGGPRATVEEVQLVETTPTPSGTSTPKKGPKKADRNKKRDKQQQQASLEPAAEPEQSAKLHNETSQLDAPSNTTEQVPVAPAEVPAQEETGIDNTSTAANQNERSWSVQTEVQTSQEPSFTPTDNLQTRLPKLEDTTAVSTPRANALPLAPPEDTVIDQPDTAVDQSGVTVTDQPEPRLETFRTFRNTKATEATQTKEVEGRTDEKIDDSQSPRAPTAEAPAKVDDEHVDDSFHTASGSPGSVRPEAAGEGSVAGSTTSTVVQRELGDTVEVEPNPSRTDTTEVESKPVGFKEPESVLSSDEAVSPKTILKVPVPQLPSKPKVTISMAEPDAKTEKSDQRSTSSGTLAPQTPAFVTAPNTPAAGQEAPTAEPVLGVEAQPPAAEAKKVEKIDKVAEKPKGPAQTQSFSLYGKKNEKKPKPNKKGTLKGKPQSGVASESSSRVVSRSTTPNADAVTHGERSRRTSKNSDMEIMRVVSKGSANEG